MQMFDVAFSRRMCCSRVWSASRYAGRPSASTDIPTRRPGRSRSSPARTAMNAACGPPYQSGTPKRWDEPTATSAPHSPGGRSSGQRQQVRGHGNQRPAGVGFLGQRVEVTQGPRGARVLLDHAEELAVGQAGVEVDAPRRRCPSGARRVLEYGQGLGQAVGVHHHDGRRRRRLRRRIRVTASATAVLSSSRDALAVSSPVRSLTMVWKFRRASRRPWLISGWYGVYAVYQAGLSRTLRRMTGGVMVPW